MKKSLWQIMLLVCTIAVFAAESLPDAVLIPRDVYIGDQALLTFSYSLSAPVDVPREGIVLSSDILPQSDDVRLDSVSVHWFQNGAEVRLSFVPWKTGRLDFPLIPFQDSFIQPPSVEIASILSQSGVVTLQPARPPLLVPGTTWMLYGVILGFLFLGTVLWFLIVVIRRWLLINPGRRLASKRIRFINRELRYLRRRYQRVDPVVWHTYLSRVLKRYLGMYFPGTDMTVAALTGSELAHLLQSHFLAISCGDLAQKTEFMIRDLFTGIDRVRFSGNSTTMAPDSLLDGVEQLSRYLEESPDNDLS